MRKLPSRHHKTKSPLGIMLFTLLFLLFTASFSGRSQTLIHIDDLRYFMSDNDIFMLPVSSNNAVHDIPVVSYKARLPIVKGIAIIIGDIRSNSSLDTDLHALAKALPDWGYNTLLIMPRVEYIKPTLSAKGDTEQNVSDSESSSIGNEPIDDSDSNPVVDLLAGSDGSLSPQVDIKPSYLQGSELPYSEKDYLNFISSLSRELAKVIPEGSGYKIIYAKGQSASAMINFLVQQDNSDAHALVVNNPYWPNMQSNQLLPQQLAKLPMPVLDLVSLSDNMWATNTINTRRTAAKVGLKSLYRQRELLGEQLIDNHVDQLSKELLSWTRFLGW